MVKKLIHILFLFLLLSCNNGKTFRIEFKEKKNLIAERIEIPMIIDLTRMTLKENLLVVAGQSTPHRIHVLSLPDLEPVQSFGNTGRGPNEISSSPTFCESPGSRYLYIEGYTRLSIKKFLLDNEGLFENKGTILLPHYESFNYMNIVNDSLLFYYIIDESKIKKYDLINERYLEGLELEKEKEKLGSRSINKGLMFMNDSLLIYAYEYKKQIDIYDMETLKLKKRLKGEYDEPTDINNLIRHYLYCYAGEKYFYLVHKGRRTAISEEEYWLPYNIEVFDYDDNPIVEYSFNDSPLLFVVDEHNGYIYSYNHITYPEYFLRYKL